MSSSNDTTNSDEQTTTTSDKTTTSENTQTPMTETNDKQSEKQTEQKSEQESKTESTNNKQEQKPEEQKTEEKKTEQQKIVKKRIRKARRQVDQRKSAQLQREEGGGEYNIWYHKYIGHKRDRFQELDPADTRVNIARDSGWTVGCTDKDPYFCLFFARGCCDKGPDCRFLHRLPTLKDEKRIPITKDCFGRDKFSTDRDDMGGVGNFNRENRTLYIGGLKNLTGVDMDEIAVRHFKEFGELEYVRVFPERCYAFIKYKLRVCAEFAKEAMSRQALDHDEVLNIRWATDDPNPMAQHREIVEKRQKLLKTLDEEGISTKQLPFNYPRNYVPPDSKLPEHLEEKKKQMIEQEKKQQQIVDQETAPNYTVQQDSLDYFNYIHSHFKQSKIAEKAMKDENKETFEQKQAIQSDVCDPYPDTDQQYVDPNANLTQRYNANESQQNLLTNSYQQQQYAQQYAQYYNYYQQYYQQAYQQQYQQQYYPQVTSNNAQQPKQGAQKRIIGPTIPKSKKKKARYD